jgi:antitoxin (DNA-binding transcriptional repressor) of toxin-antitoxin stability system
MRTVNIHAAKTQLTRLVDAAAAGQEIIIAKEGKPAARAFGRRTACARGFRRPVARCDHRSLRRSLMGVPPDAHVLQLATGEPPIFYFGEENRA